MGEVFFNARQLDLYITEHFQDVTGLLLKERVKKYCPKCEIHMGFEMVESAHNYQGGSEFRHPYSTLIQCPSCESSAMWLLYKIYARGSNGERLDRIYRLLEMPGASVFDIPGLPAEPHALRKAYNEAVRSLEANNPMAAATMFRRALQIITRNILGAKPGKLANELQEVSGKNKLGIALSQYLQNNSYIIKEIANQAAHPDKDIDLIDFTHEDAQSLYELFLEVVSELFVIPEAKERARRDLLARRKVALPFLGGV